MTHDPEKPSTRSYPPGSTGVRADEVGTDVLDDSAATDDGSTSTGLDPPGDGADGDSRNEAGSDEAGSDEAEADDDCPEQRTAWLRLLRAVLLAIVAVARLIRAL